MIVTQMAWGMKLANAKTANAEYLNIKQHGIKFPKRTFPHLDIN